MSAKRVFSRRDFLKASSLAAGAAALGACGQVATPAPTKPAAVAATATPVPAPTATPVPVELEPTPVVNAFGNCAKPLILYHGLTGTDGAVFAEMLQKYKEANPDACFESQGIAWDLFFQKFPTAVMAGNPPDMVIYHAAEVKQMASQGLVQPMDDFYTAIGHGKDEFNEVLIDQITVDGKTMTVPFDNHGWLNWVNEKVISDAGLDPNALPKNGVEFIPWAQKITKDKNGKHPTDAGFDKDNVVVWAIYWTWLRYTVPATLWQFGGAVISDDGKTALLGSPQSIAAIQYWHDLMYKYYVCPPGLPGLAYGGEMYQANGIALWWEGTWTGGYMRDRPEVAAVTRPDFINSLAPDGKQAMKFDSHVFSIPVGVPEENKAKLYPMIKYLLENGAYWATSGQVPALKSVQASPEVQKIESVAKAAEQFNAIGRTDMVHKAFVEIQTAYETAVSAAVASADTDVAKALKDGNAVIQAILDRP
ncbi:MAG: extracellular solute-binding protein [Thermoflexales bacterium]|nr:extracellular solute-binding protein [Thermoflexales bacterium]